MCLPCRCPSVLECPRLYLNPLREIFFGGNENVYLHFMSFLHIYMTQVVEIRPQVKQELTYSTEYFVSTILCGYNYLTMP